MSKCKECKKGDLHLINSLIGRRGGRQSLFVCDRCGEVTELDVK